ncbi:MAG: hypothetical protein KGH55_00250 [Nanoarchaeota archaeon]|nr:hypothetical protein [Nanoarchaeota archaeon]
MKNNRKKKTTTLPNFTGFFFLGLLGSGGVSLIADGLIYNIKYFLFPISGYHSLLLQLTFYYLISAGTYFGTARYMKYIPDFKEGYIVGVIVITLALIFKILTGTY